MPSGVSRRIRTVATLGVALALLVQPAAGANTQDLGDLTLEQLSNIVVSSASGRAEPLARALSSLYVISAEDIRRSGATTLAEALRLAPNLQVAQADANGYAITARGFNDLLANKLLVLVDGRSIYTPTFSGVFWDAQDLLLEDVQRIEVISGPGGVLWGANAVNGVINVVTESSADTRRGLATVGAGSDRALVEGRYGGAGGRYRIYAKATRLEDTHLPDGTDSDDGMERFQAGVRSDWKSGHDLFTVQGDAYTAENDQEPQPQELHGANVLGRWTRALDGGSLRVQAYYDRTTRLQQELDTADFELAHAMRPRGRHTLLWGAGLRRSRDRIDSLPTSAFIPAVRTLTSWNVYLQDVITINDRLSAAVGARADRNSYTGLELLPSFRIGWHRTSDDLVWAAWSRAVRSPSRLDRELFIPGSPPFLLAGGPSFESEISYVYEIGYRAQPAARLSWAATVFYHDLMRQRSLAPLPGGEAVVANDREGHTSGVEAWAAYRVNDRLRLWAGYNYVGLDLDVRPGAVDLQPSSSIGSDPRHWGLFRAAFELGPSVEGDLFVRHYDELSNIEVPSYTAVDLRLAWFMTKRTELAIYGRNLTDAEHVEWNPGAERERTAYFDATIRF